MELEFWDHEVARWSQRSCQVACKLQLGGLKKACRRTLLQGELVNGAATAAATAACSKCTSSQTLVDITRPPVKKLSNFYCIISP